MNGGAHWQRVVGVRRTGCKGPGAAAWLGGQGVPIPTRANGACTWPAGRGRVARLGSSEFFLEGEPPAVVALDAALCVAPTGVYPVLRADAGWLLEGPEVHDVLAQVCNLQFAALEPAGESVYMTMMIGIAVLVLPEMDGAQRRYRIWCDPSFGEYLDQQLQQIVDAGGTVAGRAAGVKRFASQA